MAILGGGGVNTAVLGSDPHNLYNFQFLIRRTAVTVARFAVAVTVAPRASRAGRDVRRETPSSGPTTRQSLSLEAHLPDLSRPHSSDSPSPNPILSFFSI